MDLKWPWDCSPRVRSKFWLVIAARIQSTYQGCLRRHTCPALLFSSISVSRTTRHKGPKEPGQVHPHQDELAKHPLHNFPPHQVDLRRGRPYCKLDPPDSSISNMLQTLARRDYFEKPYTNFVGPRMVCPHAHIEHRTTKLVSERHSGTCHVLGCMT